MLENYILTQLRENDELLEKLNKKLLYLQMEENSCIDMMNQLLENEDVGMELFSPRNTDETTREKVRMIKQQIANIQVEQGKISEKISRAKESETNYQEMLFEIRKKSFDNLEELIIEEKKQARPNEKTESNEQTELNEKIEYIEEKRKEELKTILKRVEKCFNLLYSDKSQCKHELINLKYYLKALISEK